MVGFSLHRKAGMHEKVFDLALTLCALSGYQIGF